MLLRAIDEDISPPDRIRRALKNIAMNKAAMTKAEEYYQDAAMKEG